MARGDDESMSACARLPEKAGIDQLLVHSFLQVHRRQGIINLDATDDPVQDNQEGRSKAHILVSSAGACAW